jgi:hypothetical protein
MGRNEQTGRNEQLEEVTGEPSRMRNRVVDITSIGIMDLRAALLLAMAGRKVTHWSLVGPSHVLVLFAEKVDDTHALSMRGPYDIDAVMSVVIPWLNAEQERYIEDDKGGVGYGFRVYVGPGGLVEGHLNAVCGVRAVRADYGGVKE